MKVILSPENQFILNKIYTAARTCYSSEDQEYIFNQSLSMPKEEMLKTIKHCLNSGHSSVVEHQQLTFYISGVSRALTHQLVRKRIASYSQMSQRYCKLKPEEQLEYVVPFTIQKSDTTLKIYGDLMNTAKETYQKLVDAGVPAEDARYVLPNATATNITVSLNIRSLINLAEERLCVCSQWEIRNLVRHMCNLVIEKLPFLEPYLQPKCARLGYCPESEKRTCGLRKLRKDVIGS